jgi:hypothetical protein
MYIVLLQEAKSSHYKGFGLRWTVSLKVLTYVVREWKSFPLASSCILDV